MNIELTAQELDIVTTALERFSDELAFDADKAQSDGEPYRAEAERFKRQSEDAFRLMAKIAPDGFAAKFLAKWSNQAA